MFSAITDNPDLKRLRLNINGIVQGVGFRPYIYNLAKSLQLNGFVANNNQGVLIEIEGSSARIDQFLQRLKPELPPLAEITSLQTAAIDLQQEPDFNIRASELQDEIKTLISPDIAVCDDCLAELFNPADRRFGYAFINCTNCGPRYTIIRGLPYDRPLTTMAAFNMCPECSAEYADPANRRFHAQPNACPQCGPHVWYENATGSPTGAQNQSAINHAADELISNKVIAVKGLGGFHLAALAASEEAVNRLRKRKSREEKPLAVMVADLDTARMLAKLNLKEEQLLCSPQRPIVLLKMNPDHAVTEAVAPGNQRLGLMLPYTPLHYLLFDALKQKAVSGVPISLVMTSANLSEEPICIANDEARLRLNHIADGFLMHNRDILIRADDSVAAVFSDRTAFIRRSRGYAPRPVFVKDHGAVTLGLGGELKNTICLLKDNQAFLSQHIGDLENLAANDSFTAAIEHIQKILRAKPHMVVCDMHPGYFSTQWAEQQFGKQLIKVQHHHAHLAACMAEYHLDEPVLGIILDGAGYGLDRTIWGGEVLFGDYTSIKRYAWLEPVSLQGGDRAVLQPWRSALSYLYAFYGKNLPDLPFLNNHPVASITELIDKKINTQLTSSCGRLFDAVAAMYGGRQTIKYEAQAAIELMQAIQGMEVKPFEYEVSIPRIPVKPIIRSVVNALHENIPMSVIAARFHKTLIELFVNIAQYAARDVSVKKIILSGGVFQNEILIGHIASELEKLGLQVLIPHQAPINDGGIALGQAMIGRQLLLRGFESVCYRT
jgi:hydrogenase maturation protein HypF